METPIKKNNFYERWNFEQEEFSVFVALIIVAQNRLNINCPQILIKKYQEKVSTIIELKA